MSPTRQQLAKTLEGNTNRSALLSEAVQEVLSGDGFTLISERNGQVSVITINPSELLELGLRAALKSTLPPDEDPGDLSLWVQELAELPTVFS